MQQLSIGNVTFEVVTVDEGLIEKPLLLATEKQQEFILNSMSKMKVVTENCGINKDSNFDIYDFKIDDDRYACNGIKNYLKKCGYEVEKVVYLSGFLKISVKSQWQDYIRKCLNISYAYVYYQDDAILIDLDTYENDMGY